MKWFALLPVSFNLCLAATAAEVDRPPDPTALERKLGALDDKIEALAKSNARLEADLALLRREYAETYAVRYGGLPAGLGAYVESFCVSRGKDIHVRGIETVAIAGVNVTTFECRLVLPAK